MTTKGAATRILALSAAAVLTACTTPHRGGGGPFRQSESNAPPVTELNSSAYGPGGYEGEPPGTAMMGGMYRGMGPYGGMGPGMMMGPRFQPQTQQTTPTRSSGGRLLAEYCSQCHAVPSPAQHTSAQWPAVVSRMQRYMQASSAQISHPGPPQIGALVHYLEQHAAGQQAANDHGASRATPDDEMSPRP
jgi:hypothetical protein